MRALMQVVIKRAKDGSRGSAGVCGAVMDSGEQG
jgi:hypothetical protein